MDKTIKHIDWGVLDYMSAWQRQESLMEQLKIDPAQPNYLIMVEHPHVYTIGKNGDQANLLRLPPDVELIKVNRGGDITYHGFGQVVVYPVFRLEAFGMDIRKYIFSLEEVVIRTISRYGVTGSRIEKARGVWLEPDTPAARKICAIGVRCSHFITMHGFALNANTDLSYFNNINPCGFVDKGVTSLAVETGRQIDIPSLKQIILEEFENIFLNR
ncbi:MAG: lipoyl(octanoyl) transferase LipB [Tannerella sp.]|jgi:lipoyl(octanoyl) transferase|nr:lipoyl(octanoyl) transferase LipB [Tannerella sp.]